MVNQEIAKILHEISIYLEMENIQFKPRAYEKASNSLEALEENIADIYKKGGIDALKKIPDVGKSIAEKIEEFIKTGKIKEYQKLIKKMPVDLKNLTAIEGIGPKHIKELYQKLKIKNITDLEKAAKTDKIAKLPRFGEKSQQNIIEGIKFFKKNRGRFLLGDILPQIKEIIAQLKKLKGVEQISVAGSIRRMKETVGDGDILIVSSKPKPIMDYFILMPEIGKISAHGKKKSAVKLKNGMNLDLRVVPPESFGAAMQYFTGNKDHNIALRKIAIEKGYKLNEYGIFQKIKNQKLKIKNNWVQIAGKSEDEVYKVLRIKQVPPPEIRENTGEIELARQGKLPELIGYGDIQGDLQIQTNWTDGANSIEEMAEEAKKLGLKYIVITDHTKSLAMTGGCDEKKLLRQTKEIDEINSRFKIQNSRFKILKGAEVNILKDGSLDIRDDILAKLDIVGAAIHSNFKMSKKEMTARIIKAMKNKNIDIIFHPTGRVIQKREPYELDIDEIIKVARETGTVLEIDAFPDRLDLKDEYIKKAVSAGVKLAIDTDAHNILHLRYMEYGIAQARRGWAKKSDIINAWPLEKMLKMLK